MAKIRLIKMNFTSKTREFFGKTMFDDPLFGESVKQVVGDLPDEQEIWVDTDEIRQIDTLVVEGAFKIHYKGECESKGSVDIKAECLDELLKVWKENSVWKN